VNVDILSPPRENIGLMVNIGMGRGRGGVGDVDRDNE